MRQQDALHREAAGARRMQELVRQFGTILRQITQHKWAEPFIEPVDVEGLGLHDYFEVIEKPMDFSTIKRKMKAKDGSGYKHVREICADVRLKYSVHICKIGPPKFVPFFDMLPFVFISGKKKRDVMTCRKSYVQTKCAGKQRKYGQIATATSW
ncbi:transcription factor gte6 [Nicotiana attenuata]|uniref:Transcription factor gte6 n=1 Tax=Nicotiana attenuata TaxID=49451 RepID=A0A1J6IUQ6_NICAT|nr:transcription factor gte6 [Nicotiana attenuata]